MNDTCFSAAAYVLGALSLDERGIFEEHLAGCADCRRTVAELAGVPGLLSRVSPADLADPPPTPDTLLPRLLRETRSRSRRRRWAMAVAAAAAVAAAVLTTVQLTGEPGPGPLVAMHQVLESPISARVSVTPESGGSKLWMTCHYRGQEPWDRPYALVVTDTHGSRHRLATWRVGPDGNATVAASVGLPPSQIAAVELTTMDGQTLLRLRHPA
jgi:anti-sigma-K factor RskA